MAFKNFFDKLKDKSQDIASGAKKLVSGPEEQAPFDDGMTIETTPDRPSGTHSRSAQVGAPPSSPPSGRVPEAVPPTAPPLLPPADPNRIAGLGHRNDKSSSPIVVNDANDTVYRKRSSVVDEIEEQFSRFGPRISTYLLTQLMMPNGMKMLLTKLDLRSRGFEGGDKALVENWIDLNGPDEFAKRVGLRTRDSESSNPVTANLPPETASSSAPDLRIRPMAKKVGRAPESGTRPGGSNSSNSVPLPPPTSSKPRAAAPPRPTVAPPPTATPRPSSDQEPHPADESVKIRPVAISQDAERRASMARSPLPGGADSKSYMAPPPAPQPAAAAPPPPPPPSPPPPPPPMASHIVPPILPPMPLPSPPDMGRSDETEEAPSRFSASFLQSALDESSRTGPPVPKRPPNRERT